MFVPLNLLSYSIPIQFNISNGVFPVELKLADISPIFESVDSTAKTNYRPVIILKSVSKVFEKSFNNNLTPSLTKS